MLRKAFNIPEGPFALYTLVQQITEIQYKLLLSEGKGHDWFKEAAYGRNYSVSIIGAFRELKPLP